MITRFNTCPSCGYHLAAREIKPLGTFGCPQCQRSLIIGQPYHSVLAVCALFIGATLFFELGLRELPLVALTLVSMFPIHAGLASICRRTIPVPLKLVKGPWQSRGLFRGDSNEP
jgi:hypothetical protein